MRTTIAGTILAALTAFAASSAAGQEQASPAGERTSVDLTVYNQGLALVREERPLSLQKGTGRVVLPDIPSTIDGTSVHFLSLTDPSGVKVLEQNYQYDLVHQAKILEKYIGKTVEFIRVDPSTDREYTVSGRLLSTGYFPTPQGGRHGVAWNYTGGMIAEVGGKIEINPAGRLVLPGLPEGLILRPQLEWLVASRREGTHRTEVSYLAGALSWSCDYVALLGAGDDRLDLTGWVTLTNNSGTSFKNAGLKLVAGDVNVVQDMLAGAAKSMAARAEMDAMEHRQFTQGELFEFKLYSLQRRTDVDNNSTKQVELVSGRNVSAAKVFIYDGMSAEWRAYAHNASYRSQGSFGQQSNTKVGVYVTFRNAEKEGLGIALPKGKVRVYKRDADGKEQFIGEDLIDHTPKDEELRLYLGNAFDIVGSRVQKDFKSFAGGRIVEETVEVTLRNHKKEAVEVMVYEHPWRWSEWEITRASGSWTKLDQTTLRFPVRLEKDQEKTVTYTIRYSW